MLNTFQIQSYLIPDANHGKKAYINKETEEYYSLRVNKLQ